MLDFCAYVAESENILTGEYLNKARVLVISALVGVAVNAGVVTLLNNIIISKPQNAAPLLSVTYPRIPGNPFPRPRPTIADHSKHSIIASYAVSLHTTFIPFPAPPNPGKIERPLDHEHPEGSLCLICNTP